MHIVRSDFDFLHKAEIPFACSLLFLLRQNVYILLDFIRFRIPKAMSSGIDST